jgi:hypothetical protein
LDFTPKTYQQLLVALAGQGYTFQPFAEFLENPALKCIILRHDVEARYGNALHMAKIQHNAGIRGTYYFRFLPDHFDLDIIREIASLGHEIGYHYDDLSHCHGDFKAAYRRFEKNLATLREIGEVKTICMEGAPLSKWDNRDLWKSREAGRRGGWDVNEIHASTLPRLHAHYSDYGIIGEPYFDIDFSKMLYLTDTGRRWDGEKFSVRDKVGGRRSAVGGHNLKFKIQNLKFHSTHDIIASAHLLPDQIMFTFHPQRWTDEPLPWIREIVMQNIKNVVKKVVIRWS